jgi:hypothetical protein
MDNSLGHYLANNNVSQSLIYAPMTFSSTKGHRGTLEASFSEAFIVNALFESIHSFRLAAKTTNWKHRSIHLIRANLIFSMMAYEAFYFFPKAMHHWDKYSLDIEKNSPQPVTALAHSITAVSVMMLFIKIILSKTRVLEQ